MGGTPLDSSGRRVAPRGSVSSGDDENGAAPDASCDRAHPRRDQPDGERGRPDGPPDPERHVRAPTAGLSPTAAGTSPATRRRSSAPGSRCKSPRATCVSTTRHRRLGPDGAGEERGSALGPRGGSRRGRRCVGGRPPTLWARGAPGRATVDRARKSAATNVGAVAPIARPYESGPVTIRTPDEKPGSRTRRGSGRDLESRAHPLGDDGRRGHRGGEDPEGPAR